MRRNWSIPLAALLMLAAPGFVAAEVIEWDYSGKAEMPRRQNGARAVLSDAATPDGKKSLRVWCNYNTSELRFDPVITFLAPAETVRGAKALEISFYCRADFEGRMLLRVTPRNANKEMLTDSVPVSFGQEWRQINCKLTFNGTNSADPFLQLPRILLSTVKANQSIYLGPITVKPVY